jgi:hypothetical protein
MGGFSISNNPDPEGRAISSILFGVPTFREAAALSTLGGAFTLAEMGALLGRAGLNFAITGSIFGGAVTITVTSAATGAVVLVIGLTMIAIGVFTITSVVPSILGDETTPPDVPADLDPLQIGPLVGIPPGPMFAAATNVVTDALHGFSISIGQARNSFYQGLPLSEFGKLTGRHVSEISFFGTVPTEATTGFGVGPGGAPGVAGVDSGTGNSPGGTPGGGQSP